MTDKQIMEQFGARVKARRQALGLSQDDLGNSLGLDQGRISMLERAVPNKVALTLGLAFRIANALECKLADLLP